ncbi:response regulator [Thermoclostridium stercorarium]|uniref:response regulator transcription factor n=1 Tax=Thermoclostridium stercorarium TaxID=1510 RepID=UPI0006CFCE9E|nr:response regulator [Thermoclostridium stercorarium]UZQ86103.1 response regulator [Thermoclostridium stercorarium]
MYTLLIVDDEPIIADGLYEVFQTVEDLELDIYKAYSGDEAYELMKKTRIDIVLTDIRMPGMNGLQLMEKIHRQWPKCRVIFLTGYNEFDYIYTAIQYEGVSYILKTEEYERVIGAVRNAVLEIEKSLRLDALLQEAEEQAGTAKELLRGNFLNGVIKGRFYKNEINQKQFDELGIKLNACDRVVMLVGRLDDLPKGLPYSEMTRRIYNVSLIAGEFLSSAVKYAYFTDENSYMIWLIQPGENTWQECLTFVKGNIEFIQRSCKESFGTIVSFALDDGPADWIELPDRFNTLKMVLSYRFGHDTAVLLTGRGIIKEDLRDTQEKSVEKLSLNRMKFEMLAETLEYGTEEDFFALMEELTRNLRTVRSMHNIVALEQYVSIALVLLSYINRWNILEKVAFRIGIHKLMRIDEHESWDDAVNYLYRLGSILFDIQRQEREKRAQDVVGFIQKHINDNIHIQDELTLIRLADLVHFNPSYLSRLFKQVTGMNISDYISDIRVKKAKLMLGNPDVKINTVAEALGYGTAANFTRFFKKMTNMTPQEYRDFVIGRHKDKA